MTDRFRGLVEKLVSPAVEEQATARDEVKGFRSDDWLALLAYLPELPILSPSLQVTLTGLLTDFVATQGVPEISRVLLEAWTVDGLWVGNSKIASDLLTALRG